jgi:MscS family membrane protein
MAPLRPSHTTARARRHCRRAHAGWLAPLLAAFAAAASAATPAPTPSPAPTAVPASMLARSTPRESITGFLAAGSEGDFKLGAHYLDLEGIAPEARTREGTRLARRLYLMLIRRAAVDPDTVSNEPLGSAPVEVHPREERVAIFDVHGREVPIVLELQSDASGARKWLVSRDTVGRIDGLYRVHGYHSPVDLLPAPFFSLSFLGLQLWQWVALATALLFGYGLARLAAMLLLAGFGAAAHRTAAAWDNALVTALDGPLAIVLWGLALTVTSEWVGLPPSTASLARVIWHLLTLLGIAWILFRAWDGFTDRIRLRSEDSNRVTLGYLPIISRTGKFVISVFILLLALDLLGVNVVGMLAGIGIGGIAVAFAAQKTLENWFGAATIAGDRPFTVGDYVTAGDVTGTVEAIGLRSTRIRGMDRTVTTIPNGMLAAGTIVNFSHRDRFLFNPTLGVRYETTTAQLTFILDEIRRALIVHPRVFQESHRARFTGFGASALLVEVVAWITAADYQEFSAVAEELNFAIASIVERAGTSCAFPSQTLYMARDAAADPAREQEVAREVAERRERGELAVPEPPPGLVEKLRKV